MHQNYHGYVVMDNAKNCVTYGELRYPTVQTVTDNTNIPYNWPAFLAVNSVIISLYALIRIRY